MVLLWLALCGAQALGVAHRALHGPVGASAHLLAATLPLGDADSGNELAHRDSRDVAHAGDAGDTGLFGHAPNQSDECRLFDQLVHGDALSQDGATPGSAAVPAVVKTLPVARLRGFEPCGYRARGPPLIG